MNRASWHRAVRRLAVEHGLRVETTHGGHLRLRHPSGAVYYCPSTPSDPRALQNLRAGVRRMVRA